MDASIFLKAIGFAALGAMSAVLAIFGYAFTTGGTPSDDGPRALIAEFLGFCVGFTLLYWSFTLQEKNFQWALRGLSVLAMLAALILSAYFANTPEVSEATDGEPTGFKNKLTNIDPD